jgi:hypothetical protein
VWKEGTTCGVEGRYAVEGRKAVMPRVAGKVRFKESRKEVLPILRRKSRDKGRKQVKGYIGVIISLEYAN